MGVALDPLATVDDVLGRLSRDSLSADEIARVANLIDDASASVRAYTGRTFGTTTVTRRVRPRHGVVNLGRDVTAVTSVTLASNPASAVGYTWDGADRLYVGAPWQFDVEPLRAGSAVTVTWERTDPVSESALDAIRAVVVQMVARAFGTNPETAGIQQESIAGYSYSLGSAAAAGGVGLLPDERRVLDVFARRGAVAWMNG